MNLHSETAALIERDGGSVDENAVAALHYTDNLFKETYFAPALVASKYRLLLRVALVDCVLAQIGGRVE